MRIVQFIPTRVLQVAGRPMLHVQKHSPVILLTTGVVAAVGSTVMACKATLKLESVLAGAQETLDTISQQPISDKYTDVDHKKDTVTVKVQTAVKIAKLYSPAIGLGLVSIGALTGSHYIMSSRQAGLLAAYAGLDKAYKEYQSRVREELGVDREEQLRVGSVSVKSKDEDGKTVKVQRRSPEGFSPYARLFGEHTATEWVPTPEYNILALKAKQQYSNDLLNSRGHLFLNDVYKMLGMKVSREGQIVGWVKGSGGDDFVDFGIFANQQDRIRDFMHGEEGSVWLDFNVDGAILDLI